MKAEEKIPAFILTVKKLSNHFQYLKRIALVGGVTFYRNNLSYVTPKLSFNENYLPW